MAESDPDYDRCCAKCHNPRTSEDFLKYRFKPLQQAQPSDSPPTGTVNHHVEDEKDECAICRNSYGSTNLVVMQLDTYHQVTGLPACRHVFGRACIEQLIRLTDDGPVRCPMCRTQWCHKISLTDRNAYLAPDPLGQIPYYIEKQMRIYCLDYTTMYLQMYNTPDYEQGLDMTSCIFLQEWEAREMIHHLLEQDEFQEEIAVFREKCTATLENPGFDPWDPDALLMVGLGNALSFNNWHADKSTIEQATFYASLRSPRGMRICGTAYEVYAAAEANWTGGEVDEKKLHEEAQSAGKAEAKIVQDEGDDEDFISLMLSMACIVLHRSPFLMEHGNFRPGNRDTRNENADERHAMPGSGDEVSNVSETTNERDDVVQEGERRNRAPIRYDDSGETRNLEAQGAMAEDKSAVGDE